MRRKTFFFSVGTVTFLCYAIIICLLYFHKPTNKQPTIDYEDMTKQIDNLESELKGQLKSNEVLLDALKNLKEQIIKTGKDIQNIISENPFILRPKSPEIDHDPIICVLLFACNRVTVKRSLDQLLKHRSSEKNFPIVVSQDCDHEPTRNIIQSYGDQITLISQPDQSDIELKGKAKKFKGYYKIARHYAWALNYTFRTLNYDTLIVVEDDLDIAPDFFEYFRALYPVLKTDETLYCISAWNDNGKEGLVANDPNKLYRSDFFPGLGWMLTKELWFELEHKWPNAFWDDWIREPEQRRDRACIRPELSRTRTFGKKGVSNGLFYEKHLKFIKLNEEYVPFTQSNLSYLLKENYDVDFVKKVYGSPSVSLHQLHNSEVPKENSLRITYATKDNFKKLSKALGLMDDFKSGVPRTGYRGVVTFMHKGRRVYLAPPADWKGYDVTWR